MNTLKHIYLLLLFFLLVVSPAKAQNINITDSLKHYRHLYEVTKSDISLIRYYDTESRFNRRYNVDSALYYAHLGLKVAQKTNNKLQITNALINIEYCLREKGDLAEALSIQLQTLELGKELNVNWLQGLSLNSIGNTYIDMGDPRNGLKYYKASRAMFQKGELSFGRGLGFWQMNEPSNIGNAYEKLNMPDSALYYELPLLHNKQFPSDLLPELMGRLGNAYVKLGKYATALNCYRKGLSYVGQIKIQNDFAIIYFQMAKMYDNKLHTPDSAIYYSRKALETAKSIPMLNIILSSSQLLADLYGRDHHIDSAYYYQHMAMLYNDRLFGSAKFNRIQHILSDEQQRQQKLLNEQEDLKTTYQFIGGAAIILFVLIVAILIWRNNLSQRKKNKQLDAQKTQLTEQRDELQTTIANLNKTQTQLIQSEKMASLGELTAGIAHEIQNPLNFVNNFSEVNTELIDEMQLEIEKGDYEEVKGLANDIKENQQKISQHGKRADFIVKGMLQHSRISTGEKQLTDINVLADEFLKLSYHGLRAKDKNFNAELVINFDENLPKVNIAAQDIGRVLLNLFNNAFYAVNQKSKTAGPDYKPEIMVSTSAPQPSEGDVQKLLIAVKDNGNGISDTIKDKIMQPFFTTKPTGEGTGLGLSLSYDIVVKGHGGSITVDTNEGEGSVFTVYLPIS